MVDAEVIQFQD